MNSNPRIARGFFLPCDIIGNGDIRRIGGIIGQAHH